MLCAWEKEPVVATVFQNVGSGEQKKRKVMGPVGLGDSCPPVSLRIVFIATRLTMQKASERKQIYAYLHGLGNILHTKWIWVEMHMLRLLFCTYLFLLKDSQFTCCVNCWCTA